MRLIGQQEFHAAWGAVQDRIDEVLSARLDSRSASPLAVALSGGGDSVALLLAAARWSRRAGRSLLCLTVDHRLSPLSSDWTRRCADRARALGVAHRALVWEDPKPTTGISAAARMARHRQLAQAAREAGASVILMGHTSDDRLEARTMRAQGCTVSEPREWGPSPAWPEGRGVFILRPLIDTRRAAIRAGLVELGESWVEDPANTDPSSLRARVRGGIAEYREPIPAAPSPDASALFGAASIGWAGDIALSLRALIASSAPSRDLFIGAALLSAAGTTTPPRGAAIARLWERLAAGSRTVATLAAARIESDGETVRFMRDDGALPGPHAGARAAPSGVSMVFDGRHEIDAHPDPLRMDAMRGHMARLSKAEARIIRSAPPTARRALPVVLGEDGAVTCPLVAVGSEPRGRSLVADRLAAACGAVTREAAIGRVGETAGDVLNRMARLERTVHEPA